MGSSDGAESAFTGARPAPFFDSPYLTFPALPIDAQPFDGYETAPAAQQSVADMQLEAAGQPPTAGGGNSAASAGDALAAVLALRPEDVLMDLLLPDQDVDQVHI